MGIMTNSVTFDKATIANSYHAVKNFSATSATGLLGVDINNHSVKVIELDRDRRTGVYQVTRFGYASVSQAGMPDNSAESVQNERERVGAPAAGRDEPYIQLHRRGQAPRGAEGRRQLC